MPAVKKAYYAWVRYNDTRPLALDTCNYLLPFHQALTILRDQETQGALPPISSEQLQREWYEGTPPSEQPAPWRHLTRYFYGGGMRRGNIAFRDPLVLFQSRLLEARRMGGLLSDWDVDTSAGQHNLATCQLVLEALFDFLTAQVVSTLEVDYQEASPIFQMSGADVITGAPRPRPQRKVF